MPSRLPASTPWTMALLVISLAGVTRSLGAQTTGEAGGGRTTSDTGAELARALGCAACHTGAPGEGLRGVAPPLGPGADPPPAEFVLTWLADPIPRRPELAPARMPDFRLAENERLALALHLGNGEPGPEMTRARAAHPDITAADGALLFDALGCGGCHVHPDHAEPASAAPPAPDLSRAGLQYRPDWIRDFLEAPVTVRPAGHRPGTGSRMPDFRLTDDEAAALGDWLGTLRAGPAPATSVATASPAARATPVAPATPAALVREAGGMVPDPATPPTPWALHRAERYLTDRLSCLGCHAWRGEGGRVAPPLDGLSARLTPEAIAAAVHAPAALRPGSVMPPSPFRPGILDEVTALLAADTAVWRPGAAVEIPWDQRRGIMAGWAAARATTTAPAGPAGEALYNWRCAACHGVAGDGRGFNQPFLPVTPTVHADPAAMSLRPDDTLHDGIARGGWILDRSPRMPAFGEALTRGQVRSLVDYIRTLCDCQGPAWSREETP